MPQENHKQELVALDWYTLTNLPDIPPERMQLRQLADEDFRQKLRKFLPESLRLAFDHPDQATDDQYRQIFQRLDRLIIVEAESMGPRLLQSDVVVSRLMKWSDELENGAYLLQKFGEAMVRGAKIRRGQGRGKIEGAEWYRFKEDAVE